MNEQEFQSLLNMIPAAVYTCDASGSLTYYNRRAVELWGREPILSDLEPFYGSFRMYQLDGTPLPHDGSHMAAAVRTGHVPRPNLEVMMERPDGSRITVLVNIAPLRNSAGELIGTMNCFQDISDRKLAEEGLQRNERLLRLVLDALPVGVAVVDLSGDIILSNPASQRIWSGSIRPGRERYAESQGWWHATGKRLAPGDWASVRALTKGETSINEVILIEAYDGVRKIILNSAFPIRDTKECITGAVFVNEDVSSRKKVERELNESYNQMRALTGRLMRTQDEERRRIALQLHETTVQGLIALKMNLARIARSDCIADASLGQVLSESIALTDESLQELRTLSHLLHPPLIEEAGLLFALRWYVVGFGERSGIPVTLEAPAELERLSEETEIAIFRIVQEALTNIHRHSGSCKAKVRVIRDKENIRLEVSDEGKGMGIHVAGQSGVGIEGIRERIQQLGGTLDIRSNDKGTLLKAILPMREVG